jgi:membrane associated rhomboid family serine protease
MSYSISEVQDDPRITAAVKWLIIVNVAIYFLQFTILPPESLHALGFQGSDFRSQWWTLATYMFVHGGPLHLGLNMYMLWFFGRRLERAWETGPFTRFYLWCGVGGVVAHVLMGGGGTLIGASAAVMGVMLGYAVSWPDEEVLFFGVLPMKVKWLVALYIAINMVGGIMSIGAVGGIAYFAHLGGVAFAWVYMRMPSPTSLEKLKHRISPVPDETDEPPRAVPRSLPRSREKMNEIDEIVAKSNAVASRRNMAVASRKAESGAHAAALDLVLDKISERGLESLTAAERKLLEDMSRQLRVRGPGD